MPKAPLFLFLQNNQATIIAGQFETVPNKRRPHFEWLWAWIMIWEQPFYRFKIVSIIKEDFKLLSILCFTSIRHVLFANRTSCQNML